VTRRCGLTRDVDNAKFLLHNCTQKTVNGTSTARFSERVFNEGREKLTDVGEDNAEKED
jgi:hypothetical protein